MAIDGIGGVGALNVSTTAKTRTRATENNNTQASEVAMTGNRITVEDIPPAAGKGNADNNQKQDNKDEAAVQYEGELSKEKIKDAVDDLNRQVKNANPMHKTRLSFQYHDDTNRISITVTDSDTDEVIREIPPEKALDMIAKAWEMAGLLVDEKR